VPICTREAVLAQLLCSRFNCFVKMGSWQAFKGDEVSDKASDWVKRAWFQVMTKCANEIEEKVTKGSLVDIDSLWHAKVVTEEDMVHACHKIGYATDVKMFLVEFAESFEMLTKEFNSNSFHMSILVRAIEENMFEGLHKAPLSNGALLRRPEMLDKLCKLYQSAVAILVQQAVNVAKMIAIYKGVKRHKIDTTSAGGGGGAGGTGGGGGAGGTGGAAAALSEPMYWMWPSPAKNPDSTDEEM
jgi:hypothetical protein